MKTSRIKYSKFNNKFSQIIKEINGIGQNTGDYKERRLKDTILLQADAEKAYGIENIFIETEELYKFFSITNINIQSDIAQQIYHSLKNRKCLEMIYKGHPHEIPFRLYVFRLFAPVNMISTSLAVSISCTQTFYDGFDINNITFTDKNSSQNMLLHEKSIKSLENGYMMTNYIITANDYNKKILEYYRVIMNLIFYMNAYPENIINGVPHRAVIDEKIDVSDKKITISKNIELFKKYEISPHLRRGHWRTFTSDYYTNKKGDTKWIDPMFIKGEAITVIEGDNDVKLKI
ncbi:hypothetical protein FACS189494_04680 [Spirochaetia bacterium]|nr:hypothetical protein FACS189494_04680 [Spirochaetia bacterium]